MHLNQSLHERQSNAKATLGAVQSSLCLREKIENARQEVGRNSDTRIPHAQDGFVSFLLKGDPDFSAFAGVFGWRWQAGSPPLVQGELGQRAAKSVLLTASQ